MELKDVTHVENIRFGDENSVVIIDQTKLPARTEIISLKTAQEIWDAIYLLQVRGVRPFLSDKYDLTQHPNYKYTSDYDKKNTFDIEKFLEHRLKLRANDEYEVTEV